MAVGGQDSVVGAEVALDRSRLGRRLDDHEVLRHGRECSTGSLARPLSGQASRMRRRKSSSISRSASTSGAAGRDVDALPDAATSIGPGRIVCTRTAPRRDLHEPDMEVREEEDRGRVVDEDGALPIQRAQVGAAQADVAGRRRLVQVGKQRLLVHDVQDGVPDHAPDGGVAAGLVQPADGPVRGGRSRPPGGRGRTTPRRRSRPGRRPGSSG